MISKNHDYSNTDLKLLVKIDFMYSSRNIILDLFRAWLEKDLKKYFLAVLS